MKIQFVSQAVAERITPTENMAIISVTSPREWASLKSGWKDTLRLQFDDIDRVHTNIQLLVGTNLFLEHQAEEIIDFLDKNKDVDELIVHCMAGISRSSAIAKFAAEKFNCNDFLHRYEKYDLYNKHVYRTLKEVDNPEYSPYS